VPLDQLGRLGHVDVPGDGEHRVAGRVVPLEEALRVRYRRRLQVHERAVPVVRVGEGVEHDRRQLQPGEAAVRPVEHVDPDLLLDHVDLVAQVFLGQPGAAHPVGLQEQRALQGVGRQGLEVVGVVQVGGAVEGAPRALYVSEVRQLLQVFRALEHQVLEEVGEAGAPLRFRADAHVVHHRHADHRRGTVRREDHPQPVGQGEPLGRIGGCGDRHGAVAFRHAATLTRRLHNPSIRR
jgi:hypothetical protein